MKVGDKLICINNDLLEKDKTYYFDHYDIWDIKEKENVYVKDENNMIYWAPRNHFISLKQERKFKLEKINGKR